MSDTNVNLAVCIQKATDFGVTHIHNVCSGTVTNVPWGSADWLFSLGATAFGFAVIGAMAGMALEFLRGY